MDIDDIFNLGKLSSAQAIKRGNIILDKDHESLQKITKIINKNLIIMKKTNKEFYRQMEAINKVEDNLKEIEKSLNRVKKIVTYMNK